jgi:hypothetical protein
MEVADVLTRKVAAFCEHALSSALPVLFKPLFVQEPKIMRKTYVILMFAGLTTGVFAQTTAPQAGEKGGREHKGPPPAAIAACKGLASGAGCSFVGRENQNLSGTCFSPRTDRPLACRPPQGAKGSKGGAEGKKG